MFTKVTAASLVNTRYTRFFAAAGRIEVDSRVDTGTVSNVWFYDGADNILGFLLVCDDGRVIFSRQFGKAAATLKTEAARGIVAALTRAARTENPDALAAALFEVAVNGPKTFLPLVRRLQIGTEVARV